MIIAKTFGTGKYVTNMSHMAEGTVADMSCCSTQPAAARMSQPKSVLTSGGVWPVDSVMDVAQSCGIEALAPDVATALAGDVEYRIHEVVEEAVKFMRHAKRSTLKPDDIDFALKVKNIDPLWGFSLPLVADPTYLKTSTSHGNIYVPEDEEVDLSKLLSLPLPPVPRPVSYTAHWLAVEGVQPAVPQNPTPSEIQAYTQSLSTSQKSAAVTTTNKDGQEVDVRPLVKHVLSRELQLYFDRLTTALLPNDVPNSNSEAETQDAEMMRAAAFASLRQDQGLSGLIPYLIQWAGEKVSTHIAQVRNPAKLLVCETSLNLLEAMLGNKTMFVEPYLHQFMPTILTCLLNTFAPRQVQTLASQLLAHILKSYSHAYPSLKVRIMKTLLRALVDPSKTNTTRLGALSGLIELGPGVVRQVLGAESNLKALGKLLDQDVANPEQSAAVEECAHLVIVALEQAYPSDTDEDDAMMMQHDDASLDAFGSVLGEQFRQHPRLLEAIRTAAAEALVDTPSGTSNRKRSASTTTATSD